MGSEERSKAFRALVALVRNVQARSERSEPAGLVAGAGRGRSIFGDIWLWVKARGAHFWGFGALILGPILVVGLGCELEVRGFDSCPYSPPVRWV